MQMVKSPGLSLREVWNALPGWVSLTILLILTDLVGFWISTSRLAIIVFLIGAGVLTLCLVVWLVRRTRDQATARDSENGA